MILEKAPPEKSYQRDAAKGVHNPKEAYLSDPPYFVDVPQSTSYIATLSSTLFPANNRQPQYYKLDSTQNMPIQQQMIHVWVQVWVQVFTRVCLRDRRKGYLFWVMITRFIIFRQYWTGQRTKKRSWFTRWTCVKKRLVVNQSLRHEIPQQKHMMRRFNVFHHHD